MTQTECKFDPALHAYYIGGRRVPSVTQVLGDLIPGRQADEYYLGRGTAIHACAAMIAREQAFSFDPQITGHVRAVRRFFAEVKPDVLAVEQQVYHAGHQYAGMFDMLARLPGENGVIVFDWKSSITVACPYQCAAYALAIPYAPEVSKGCAVEIRDDGTYRMSPVWDLRRYKQKWLTLLSAYNIRRECGIKEGGDA